MKIKSSIKSVAISIPQKYCDNNTPPFSEIPNVPKNWERLWGIKGRYMIDKELGESCSVLAKDACEKAIDKAGLSVQDIDLIIATSCTITGWSDKNPEMIFPGLSDYLKTELQCNNATMTLEVNQTCISFMVALQIASDYVEAGMYKNVLICSSETFTILADFRSSSSTLFGDGSGAVVVGQSKNNGSMLAAYYKSIPTHNEIATLQWRPPLGNTNKQEIRPYFTLEENGPALMQTFVPQNVPVVALKAIEKANLSVEDIDHFVFHQPSPLLLKMWAMGIGIKNDKYTNTVEKYSCLSSASTPLTLYKALKNGKISPNNTIVIAGASIGWGFGAQVWNVENINF
jgi:3-oxoacyl-[acyl-carrier-protein] synthase-3